MKFDGAGKAKGDLRSPRVQGADAVKRLLIAGARASSLGIAVLDSQTRFTAVNSALARETLVTPENHLGRTSREVVGSIASQAEPIQERVLSTGKAESLLAIGHIRDTPITGYWFNRWFPIMDSSGRTQQLGQFEVNVTAERAAVEIFDALATDSKRLVAEASGLLDMFDESIKHYHVALTESFDELASPFGEAPRKLDHFRSAIVRLDNEISTMRELVYAVVTCFSVPEC